jgi:hypothetical protein
MTSSPAHGRSHSHPRDYLVGHPGRPPPTQCRQSEEQAGHKQGSLSVHATVSPGSAPSPSPRSARVCSLQEIAASGSWSRSRLRFPLLSGAATRGLSRQDATEGKPEDQRPGVPADKRLGRTYDRVGGGSITQNVRSWRLQRCLPEDPAAARPITPHRRSGLGRSPAGAKRHGHVALG